mmetsp:Transcript_29387/g.57353  ORF Transcript_29387/g.57353 Transcript_29387/m.57353 type:complete len:231 (-) Transcript_29387:3150-3842(-)
MSEAHANLIEVKHIMVQHLLTILSRDKCKHNQYRLCLNQIYWFLAYEALRHFEVPTAKVDFMTPASAEVRNQDFILSGDIVIVAMMRGGMAPAASLNSLFPKSPVAHIGTEGGKDGGKAKVTFKRIPRKMHDKRCLLIAPRIETGASVEAALRYIKKMRKNRSMSEIVAINVVCAPEGAAHLLQVFPDVKIVTASLERGLNDAGEVLPGIGHTGERIYETVNPEGADYNE